MARITGSTEEIAVYDHGQRVYYSVQFDGVQLYEFESYEGIACVLSKDDV
jgi:hypothetical protein